MKINKEEWIEGIQEFWAQPDPDRRKRRKRKKDNNVDHPLHYNKGKYEAIEVIEDWQLGFHCGSAIKYIARHKHKESPKQDIEKAIWCLQRYLEKM
jgi:hypothetical protein